MFRKSLALAFASIMLLVTPAAAQYGGGPGLPIPVPVSKGGTGATTAAGARTSLGVIGAGSSSACGTVTISTPCLDLTQTWNNAGVTFTGLKLNVTDTASAAGSLLLDLQKGGVSQFSVSKAGTLTTTGPAALGDGPGDNLVIGANAVLWGEAANVLALRNGASAQALNIYNSYTDGSNYERGFFAFRANVLSIGSEALGTGTLRAIALVAGSNSVTMTPGASNLLTLNGSLTIGGTFLAAGHVRAGAGSYFYFNGGSQIGSPADGNVLLANSGGSTFGLLQFGGTTSSFPALKRNTTNIEIRLADDSARSGLLIGALNAGGEGVFGTYVKTQSTTVAGLTAAATAGAGARSFVTDALGPTFGAAVVGGGAVSVPVSSDGTNWIVGANDNAPDLYNLAA